MEGPVSRRPYVREMSKSGWWLSQHRYVGYMIRELSCILIGAYTAVLVVGLIRVSQDQAAYVDYLDTLWGPVGFVFHAVAFLFALYHSISWFNVTPKAMPLRMGDRRVPGGAIIGAHYAGWAVVSAAVLFLAGV